MPIDPPIGLTDFLSLGLWGDEADPGFEALNNNWVLIDEAISAMNDIIASLGATYAAAIHATRHESGGADEIDVTGLLGLLGTPQTPITHAARHEDGGDDEIDVTGLAGLLADPQTPLDHAASHVPGGGDPLNLGRMWQFYGSLESVDNAPWWTEREANTYTFIDLDIDELPAGSDVTVDIVKQHLGVETTVASISISPSDTGKYVFDDGISFSTVAGDKLRAIVTAIGSVIPGSSAACRVYPI